MAELLTSKSGLDAADIIGKAFTNLLRKSIDVTDCLVLLTQEMADHIFQLYNQTDNMDNIELPFELTEEILNSHVGEYVWMESFDEPVTDICSFAEFPRPFRMMFMDLVVEMGILSMEELFYVNQNRMMDMYHAVRLMQSNHMQNSEIVQTLSKAKLPELDIKDFLYLAAAKARAEISENLQKLKK